uniref:XS domain containing protein-like n=1 Tax=Oryza sativa subsp. japonica TaxID=39947 RepID=Q5Z4D2_ORYSJ|nr:XS domain containing protein-like [Oryza sativa Japonica Group]
MCEGIQRALEPESSRARESSGSPIPSAPPLLRPGPPFFIWLGVTTWASRCLRKETCFFTMRANLQPEMTSDKQYARLLLRPPAFSGDAHFNLHLLASDFLAMLALKPGMDLTGTDIPTPGVSTPAPARDESQEALIIPTGRGEACDRPPVAT